MPTSPWSPTKFVYVGNVAVEAPGLSHTRCPQCHEEVIRRAAYETLDVRLRAGACPHCHASVPGLW